MTVLTYSLGALRSAEEVVFVVMLFTTARACTVLAQTAFADPHWSCCACRRVSAASVSAAPSARANSRSVRVKSSDGVVASAVTSEGPA